MVRQFFIVVNSLSEKATPYLLQVKDELNRISAKYRFFETSTEENAGDLILTHLSEEYTDILILGGDGTIYEVINALPDFHRPIGILPAGTGNDFFRMIHSDNPVQSALFGSTIDIDVGVCNDFKFINGVGCAIEGESAKLFEEKRIGNRVKGNYFLSILMKIFTYRAKTYKITFDDDEHIEDAFFLLTIGNGRFFGSGYKLTPRAKLTDGLLDVIFVKQIPSILALFIMAIVPKGWHTIFPFVHTRRVHRVSIKSDHDFFLHADGEVKKEDHLMISLHEDKLKIRS